MLWAVGIPTGQPVGSYVGQLLVAESILLLPHILLSTNPRGAGIGGTLGLVGLLGLIALVAWAILPAGGRSCPTHYNVRS